MRSSYDIAAGLPYFHGVTFSVVNETSNPINTFQGFRQGVIVVVGTAANAVADSYPLNTPVLMTGTAQEIADLGDSGELLDVTNTVFANGNRQSVVMIRVEVGADDTETIDNIVGGVGAGDQPEGLEAVKAVQAVTGVEPGIVIAPHWSSEAAVQAKLNTLLPIVHAIGFVDAVKEDAAETTANLMTLATGLDNERLTVVYPNAKIDAHAATYTPGSVFAALAESKTAPHTSSSNTPLPDIVALSQKVDYQPDDGNATANQLNEKGVATFVNIGGGYRFWGIRCTSTKATQQNRHWIRIADKLRLGALDIMQARQGANIDADFANYAVARMQSLINNMVDAKEITGGRVWLDPEANTSAQWLTGQFVVNTDFGRYGSAEKVIVIGRINDGYYDDIVAAAVGG